MRSTTTSAINLPTRSTPKPKKRVQRTKAQWKALLEEYASSGLTQTAFCQQQRIAPSGLCKWRKYFADQSAESHFIDITESLSKAAEPLPEQARDERWQVELELGLGVILRIRAI